MDTSIFVQWFKPSYIYGKYIDFGEWIVSEDSVHNGSSSVDKRPKLVRGELISTSQLRNKKSSLWCQEWDTAPTLIGTQWVDPPTPPSGSASGPRTLLKERSMETANGIHTSLP